MCADSAGDLLEALIQHVVMECLLGIDQDENQGKGVGKTTHERRALALCIVRNLAGVEFVSSVAGRTRLIVEPQILESIVLTPVLVKRLFLDVMCAGKGGKSKQAAHLLKPLSLKVPESIVQTVTERNDSITIDNNSNSRLALLTSFICCDPRFDSRTKTATVGNILGLGSDTAFEVSQAPLIDQFVSFVEKQIAIAEPTSDHTEPMEIRSYEATGYVDILFYIAKQLLKSDTTKESELTEYKNKTLKRILGFLMIVAFFDCKSVDKEHAPQGRKKKNRRSSIGQSPLIQLAAMIKTARSETTSSVPYDVRTVLSARFFSLVAESVATIDKFTSGFASKLLREVKFSVDEEHQSLCNHALIFMLRNIPDKEEKLERALAG